MPHNTICELFVVLWVCDRIEDDGLPCMCKGRSHGLSHTHNLLHLQKHGIRNLMKPQGSLLPPIPEEEFNVGKTYAAGGLHGREGPAVIESRGDKRLLELAFVSSQEGTMTTARAYHESTISNQLRHHRPPPWTPL
ncbi:hypothetical protein GW17_00050624 [Ensete ventricosum]|nr:hypothetical protein GW17_00050624 [Ensete ventricosum]